MAQTETTINRAVPDSRDTEALLTIIDRQMVDESMFLSVPTLDPDDLIEKGLSGQDVSNINETLRHRITKNTWKIYRSQWLRFARWAVGRGVVALPAEPALVAAYLAERFLVEGAKPATLRNASASIAYVHRISEERNPCTSALVAGTLSGAARMSDGGQKQAAALTEEVFDAIRAVVREPRMGRGGYLESTEYAGRRGELDIAMIAVMRDCLLRVSEASELIWSDIEGRSDGSGRLLIRRSKTDQEGKGTVRYLSPETMSYLHDIRNGAADGASIIGLSENQISNRIKLAALQAGFGDDFSGHSPRVGMAIDLAREGTELPALMNAGGWSSSEMPARYIRNEAAGRNAVARYHQYRLRAGRLAQS